MNERIAAVRAYALEHYNEGGWDILVECWEDADIEKAIGTLALPSAIAQLRAILKQQDDRRRDIQAEAF